LLASEWKDTRRRAEITKKWAEEAQSRYRGIVSM